MLLTHTFVATVSPGWYKYFFYVLYGNRVDFHDRYINEFRLNLQDLGYALQEKGVVVEPFPRAVDATREQVWLKDWTVKEREELEKVPALLVLTKDMSEFSPRSDPWLLFPFTERQYLGDEGRLDLRDAFTAVAEAVVGPDVEPEQLYRVARELTHNRSNIGKIFEAKPGVWGFSIDLFKVADALRSQLRNRRHKIGRWPKRYR